MSLALSLLSSSHERLCCCCIPSGGMIPYPVRFFLSSAEMCTFLQLMCYHLSCLNSLHVMSTVSVGSDSEAETLLSDS